MGKVWTDDDYIIKYDVRQETSGNPVCGQSRRLSRFDDRDSAVEYAKNCAKRDGLDNVYVEKRRYASERNLQKDFFMDSQIVWASWFYAEVSMGDDGVTRCTSCGAEILCNDCGDMPEQCPECRCVLDYSKFEAGGEYA